jgi:hypothetical protein
MTKNTIENKQQYQFSMIKLKTTLRLPNIIVDFNPIQKYLNLLSFRTSSYIE